MANSADLVILDLDGLIPFNFNGDSEQIWKDIAFSVWLRSRSWLMMVAFAK